MQSLTGSVLYVTYGSVYIAFVEFIGILIFHILWRVSAIKCFKNFRSQHLKRLDKKKEVISSGTRSHIEINQAVVIMQQQNGKITLLLFVNFFWMIQAYCKVCTKLYHLSLAV